MARAITKQNETEPTKRILKSIPTEIVGTYMAIDGFLKASATTPNWLYWLFFGILLVITPIWLRYGQDVKKGWQLTLSTVAFPIWVMSLPGPFSVVPYAETIGGALILIWSGLVAPMWSKNAEKQ